MIEIRRARWPDHAPILAGIRRAVFVLEQGVPEELEWDGEDASAIHLLAVCDGSTCATARVLRNGQIGRMAVLKPYRRRGIARALLAAAIAANAEAGWPKPYVHAQTAVAPLYASAGFVAEGAPFEEAGIPHQLMRLKCPS